MTILADFEIKELCINYNEDPNFKPMISPFKATQVKEQTYTAPTTTKDNTRRVISYGLSSFGYDIRLKPKDLKVFTNINSLVIDPRRVDPRIYAPLDIYYDGQDNAPFVILPPNTGMLGHTVETFNIPKDVLGSCTGKSTYARCFISVIVTPLEPGWSGELVVEVVNHGPLPARVYLDQGIAQLTFLRGNACETNYEDRNGKYQQQVGTQDAIV